MISISLKDCDRTIVQIYGGSPKKKGSLEEFFLRLSCQLREKGFRSVFVFNRECSPELANLFEEAGAHIEIIPDNARLLDPVAIVRFVRLYRKHRPTLVNFHFGAAYPNGLIAAWLASVRNTIWTRHSFYEKGPFYQSVSQWRIVKSRILWLGLLTRTIIAVSEGVKKELCCYHLPAAKIIRIYLGINLERFAIGTYSFTPPEQLGIETNERVISCISQARTEKGLEYLVRALPSVVERFPTLKLLIVGGGPLTDILKLLAQKLKIEKNVCFCGVRNDVERILSISEFTVLPSLTEGMPLALLESLAVGKPVIASNVGGIPEVIRDGEQGILVPPGDEKALATAINTLLSNVPRTQEMGKHAATRARAFDVKKGVAETIDLYQGIING